MCKCIEDEGVLKVEMVRRIAGKYLLKILWKLQPWKEE